MEIEMRTAEEIRAYQMKYHEENKDRLKEKAKEYYRINNELYRDRSKKRYQQIRDGIGIEERKKHREYLKKRKSEIEGTFRNTYRLKIILALGDKCNRCGFTDLRALQIDHVYGFGVYQIRTFKGSRWNYYKKILEEINKGSKEYQILCANCNWIKRYENQEYKKVGKKDYALSKLPKAPLS